MLSLTIRTKASASMKHTANRGSRHEPGELIEVALPEPAADNRKVDSLESRCLRLSRVRFSVLAELPVFGAERISIATNLRIDDRCAARLYSEFSASARTP